MIQRLNCKPGRALACLATVVWLATIALPASAQDEAARSDPRAIESFRSAVALQNRGLYDLAADEWSGFLDRHADDPLANRARYYRGVCLFQVQRYDEAATDFENVLSGDPDFEALEEVYANLGLTRYNQAQAADGNAATDQLRQQAIDALGKQLERFPDGDLAAQAHYYRAEALYALQQLDAAVDDYLLFVDQFRQFPQRPQALYGLGVAQQELDQLDAADATFDRFLSDYPQHELLAEVVLRRGETLMAQGKTEQAEQQFQKAAETDGFAEADYALERQAAARFAAKNYLGAAAVYQSLVTRFPESELVPKATLAAGKCLLLADQPSRAIEWLERAHDLENTDGEAAHWLARAQLDEGQPQRAVDTATRALEEQPSDEMRVELELDRADAWYEIPDQRDKALAAYVELSQQHGDHPLAAQAAYMAAYSALELADYPAAFQHAEFYLARFEDRPFTPDVKYVAAEAQLQLGEYADAARRYAQLLQGHPRHEHFDTWLVRKALSHNLAKNWPGVIDTLAADLRGIDSESLRAEAGLLLGKAYSAAGQFPKAVETLSELEFAAADWKQADEVMFHLATARQAAGDPDAEADFRAVVRRWPGSPLAPRAMLAMAQIQSGQAEDSETLATLDELLKKYPDSSATQSAYLLRATVRHQLEMFPGAIEDVAAFLEFDPAPPARSDAMYIRGLCEAALGRHDEARTIYESILQNHPDYQAADRVLYELAWTSEDAGTGDATAVFRKLAAEYPESPLAAECWYRVGEAEFSKEDFTAAAESFSRAETKATGPDIREKAIHKLAWSRFEQGDYQRANEEFQRQLEMFPDRPLAADARLMQAETLFQRQEHEQALAAFVPALEDEVSNKSLEGISLLHAGQAAAQVEKWQQCLDLLNQCLARQDDADLADEARYEKGWALYNLGQVEEARPLFEQVAAGDRSVLGARAQFMVGEVQFATKNYDDAVRTFFKVAYGYGDREAPEPFHHWQAEAMFEAARCLRQTGRTESAGELYRELIDRFPDSEKAELARHQLQ